jgi:hypothetical protein
MRKPRPPLFVLLALFAFLTPGGARAEPLVGVNNVHIGWLSAEKRAAVIQDMAQANVRSVRVALMPPVDKYVDALVELNAAGMSIDLVIDIVDRFLVGEKVQMRGGRTGLWSAAPLSQIDVAAFKQRLGALFQQLENRGVRLASIEVGNEINWAPYNGDMALTAEGGKPVPGAPGAGALRAPAAFDAGLRRYLDILRAVRELRAESVINRSAKIISGGLAYMPASYAAGYGAEYVDARETLDRLIELGLPALVDGYGLHYYPSVGAPASRIAGEVDALFSACGAGAGKRPCWMTEWGVRRPSGPCPADDALRAPMIAQFRSILDERARRGQLAGWYYFDWRGDEGEKDGYAVWTCGELTESGRRLFSQ